MIYHIFKGAPQIANPKIKEILRFYLSAPHIPPSHTHFDLLGKNPRNFAALRWCGHVARWFCCVAVLWISHISTIWGWTRSLKARRIS